MSLRNRWSGASTFALGAAIVSAMCVWAQGQGPTEIVLHSFGTAPKGAQPSGPLVLGLDGNFYGTTQFGGTTNHGTVFRLSPAGDLTVLYSFQGGADGFDPISPVSFDPSGNIYGTTSGGGASNDGTVYRLDKFGTETVLYSFTGRPDGASPSSGLVRDALGDLFGTTISGGAEDLGTVFKINPEGNAVVLHSFRLTEADGVYPQGGLILDSRGDLYGTTSAGGSNKDGTVFRIDLSGNETVLYSFLGTDGSEPMGALTFDAAGNLYGTASAGGANNNGVVFELMPNGQESVLYSFTGGSDGGNPFSSVVLDRDGNLYGTTFGGGADLKGVVYELEPSGRETVLATFGNSLVSGANPKSGLIFDSGGNLYGVTLRGGLGSGLVFRVNPKAQYSNVYIFASGESGTDPSSPVVRDAAGNLYGATYLGGLRGLGVIYKFDASGRLEILHSFSGGSDGTHPTGVYLDPAGSLLGTTEEGGAANAGVVFKIGPDGSFNVLYTFKGGPDGANPWTGVIEDLDGNLYGAATAGGASGNGVIYQVDPAGNETVLYSFAGAPDGQFPVTDLIRDSEGNLFGTTAAGGEYKDGTVFRISRAGKKTTLFSFNDKNGATPTASIARDAEGNLYGTTIFGGSQSDGVIYKIDSKGNETILYEFEEATGQQPIGGVTLDSSGNLYGTTFSGGTYSGGIVYQLSAAGVFTDLYNFVQFGPTGGYPRSAPVLDEAGNLFGTCSAGGADTSTQTYAGVLYELSVN